MSDKKTPIWILGLLLAATIQWLHAAELRPDHPERYIVKKGDTLWDISDRFLEDPWNWPNIWHINPQVANPHLIYPGDVLALIYIDGKPRITRVTPKSFDSQAEAPKTAPPPKAAPQDKHTVKLQPKARSMPLNRPIASLPQAAVRQFLTRTRMVLSPAELEKAPYIVDTLDKHLITGSGTKIYVRTIPYDEIRDFSIYRPGDPYVDPVSEEILGYEALYLGDASLVAAGDPASLVVQRAVREILHGDRLMPNTEEEGGLHFTPHAPDFPVKGQIIAVVDGVSQIGQYQTVALNLGQRQDVKPGHVLAVFQTGGETRDTFNPDGAQMVTLPEERAGVVIVFRTFRNMSYALVLSALRPMNLYDTVSNP